MKKRTTTLLALLSLASAITVGCGDNHSVPPFTKLPFISDRTVTGTVNLFVANLDGKSVTPVPFNSGVFYPSISANARTVVFASQGDIWVGNLDGTNQKQLTTTGETAFERISPNGKKILFGNFMATGEYHEWIMNADGSGSQDLTATPPTGMNGCYSASFSADSASIALTCYGSGTYGLYTMKTDGTGMKTISTQTSPLYLPWFTPDGKKIIYNGYVSGTLGVVSVNLDGTGATMLVPNSNEAVILNSTLYYSLYDSTLGIFQIYKANVDGTSAVSISDGTSNDFLGQAGG